METTLPIIVLVIALGSQVKALLQTEAEVSFPEPEQTSSAVRNSKEVLAKYTEIKPVFIENILAYYISFDKTSITRESLDQIKPGLTLGDIIGKLGPGCQPPWVAVGIISWHCEDGRVLEVLPHKLELNEKADYWITVTGVDQKHELIAKMARDLVADIKIRENKAWVTLTKNTYQVRAGKAKAYGIGDSFQKTDPLPRLDFTILKIDGDSIHCKYFYQAKPEGLVRYSETGLIILKGNP